MPIGNHKEKYTLENQKIEANKRLFAKWVTNPSGIDFKDSTLIQSIAKQFPYCQILQALEAKSLQKQNPETFAKKLSKASLYSPNRTVLFNLINHPEKLIPVHIELEYEVIENGDYSADLISHENLIDPQPLEFKADENIFIEEVEHNNFNEAEVEDEPAIATKHTEVEPSIDQTKVETKIKEEKMILENISATDFFAFEEKLYLLKGDLIKVPDHIDEASIGEREAYSSSPDTETISETSQVARYDDDQMPYSFLWWLHKTRKEHAETYQPYVDFKLDTSRKIKEKPATELNQQIIENIFHLQSPLDEMDNKQIPQTIHFEVKRKEEEIIEKFIREEPQIHAPSPDKLDMENKARKSAEDPNDLVSETLASIYTEQMLFHKAIDTYQKLSLKFPEKRAYFTDQISELEKKIN